MSFWTFLFGEPEQKKREPEISEFVKQTIISLTEKPEEWSLKEVEYIKWVKERGQQKPHRHAAAVNDPMVKGNVLKGWWREIKYPVLLMTHAKGTVVIEDTNPGDHRDWKLLKPDHIQRQREDSKELSAAVLKWREFQFAKTLEPADDLEKFDKLLEQSS